MPKILLNLTVALLFARLARADPSICSPIVSIASMKTKNLHEYNKQQRCSHCSQTDPRQHLMLILLQANDVELNPGPISRTRNRVYKDTDTTILLPRKRNCKVLEQAHKKDLFSNLPIIEPNEYAGECYCKGCWKPVYNDDKAISCDTCDQWTHLRHVKTILQ